MSSKYIYIYIYIYILLLKHLWKEDTKPSPIFHNLENLSVTMLKIEKFSTPLSVFQKFDDSRYIEMSWID